MLPLEILGVTQGTYEGVAYQTLTVRHDGNNVLKLSAKDGFDYEPHKDKGVVFVECELRAKNGYLNLRAVGVGTPS